MKITGQGQQNHLSRRSDVSALATFSHYLIDCSASVDLETDRKIQFTIQREFRDRTMICIAHRLRTILSYDRM